MRILSHWDLLSPSFSTQLIVRVIVSFPVSGWGSVGFHYASQGLRAIERQNLSRTPCVVVVGAVQPNLRELEVVGGSRGSR